MTNLVRTIKEFLETRGAATVGIVSSSDVEDALQVGGTPLLETAQSVVCFGIPLPEGVFAAQALTESQYWRTASMLYRRIDFLSIEAANFLETQGYQSLPLFTCFPQYTDRPRYIGAAQLVPIAVAAGLGGLAKCGLVIAKDFGLRLLLGGILTTAILKPQKSSQIFNCPPDCVECIDACPVEAISSSGKVDHEGCLRRSTLNPLFAEYIRDKARREEYGFDILLNTLGVEDHSMYTCIACVKACPQNYSTR
jgi:epoxyqueuosine reductase QueG